MGTYVVTVDLDASTVTVKQTGKVYPFKPLGEVRPVVDAGVTSVILWPTISRSFAASAATLEQLQSGVHRLLARTL